MALLLHEVGLRDGLQMEKQVVPTEQKIAWIEALMASGVDIVQVGSFVHPEKVPQMADTDELFAYLSARKPSPGVTLSGLVLNEKGLDRGLACGVEHVLHGRLGERDAQPEEHRHGRPRRRTRGSWRWRRAPLAAGKRVQVSVQSAFGCGFEGPVPKERVVAIVGTFLDAGLRGLEPRRHRRPRDARRRSSDLYARVRALDAGRPSATCHFHNTYGLALANCYAARQRRRRVLRVVGRRPRRLPVHEGGRREHLHRGPRPRAAAERRSAPTSTSTRSSTWRAASRRSSGARCRGRVYRTGPIPAPARPAGGGAMSALAGVRVLDLTNVLSGPFATLHLALLGADVDQDREPEGGRPRAQARQRAEAQQELMGTSFLAQNANKKSLTLNLKAPEGKEIFKKLVDDGRRRRRELPPRRDDAPRPRLRRAARRSTRGSSTARSRASARPAPTPTSRPTTRSSRASRA